MSCREMQSRARSIFIGICTSIFHSCGEFRLTQLSLGYYRLHHLKKDQEPAGLEHLEKTLAPKYIIARGGHHLKHQRRAEEC